MVKQDKGQDMYKLGCVVAMVLLVLVFYRTLLCLGAVGAVAYYVLKNRTKSSRSFVESILSIK